jgi:methionyl-tRNA formyltransferase
MIKKDLRIVFMGTPEFAVPVLKAILDGGYNVAGVITAPDRNAGRGRKLKMSAVKEFALQRSLHILQPTNLKDPDFLSELKKVSPNLQIVVAFRMLPQSVWSLPEYGTFNLHASLLPQYRGASPINFAIINGEKETGLSTFYIDEKIDTGRIIDNVKIRIDDDDTAGTLHDKMMILGASLVLNTLRKILSDNADAIEQDSLQHEFHNLKSAPKLLKEDCHIKLMNNPDDIRNFVRGLSPYPAAYLMLELKSGEQSPVKIFKIKIMSYERCLEPSGTIITDNTSYIDVVSDSGIIRICELQVSGKKRMTTQDFLRGFKNIKEYRFT